MQTLRQFGFVNPAASRRVCPKPVPVGLCAGPGRRQRQSRNRSLFIETEICDFRPDRARAACSAPLSNPCGPSRQRAFGSEELNYETLRGLISLASPSVAKPTPSETLRRAFRNASNVESQESCIHPMLSHTALARPVLLCFPLPSRQKYRQENGYKYSYKYGYKKGRFHVSLLPTVYTFQGDSRLGAQGPFLRREVRASQSVRICNTPKDGAAIA